MDILVICQYFSPEEFQINDICADLAKRHNVTVLTGLPNYPSGRVPDAYRRGKQRSMRIMGADVIRCFEIGRGNGKARLALNYISFALSASRKARKLAKRHWDVVFVYQLSPVLMALPGLVVQRRGTPLCMYCCDLWPESMKALIPGENAVFRLMKPVSRKIYRAADTLAVQNAAFRDYLAGVHGVEPGKITVLPHFADDSLLTLDAHEDNGVFDFVFLGNLGKAQGLEVLLEAAASLRDLDGFLIHLVGDGSDLEELKGRAKTLRVEDRVLFYERRPREEMPLWYRVADACVLTLRPGGLADLTIPSKLQGYMAAGMPVLASVDGQAARVIRESGCGLTGPAGDSEALAENMRRMISDPALCRAFGEAGRAFYRANYTREEHMERLEALLAETANERKCP